MRNVGLRALFGALLIIHSNAFAQSEWSRADAAHLLRRAGFGGTPAQIDNIHALGRDTAVEYLITGKLPPGAQAPWPRVELMPFALDPEFNLFNLHQSAAAASFEIERLEEWWLDRMIRTDRPLEEKMALFWHGLLTSGFLEVPSAPFLVTHCALIHREAIGNYKRLALSMIHDPAMILYLNNDQNIKGRPNENLARELMELFTMGESCGYTENDVPQVARALTGLTARLDQPGSMFIAQNHDNDPKTIFGQTGNYMPDDVIDLIFQRQEPSIYLSRRLWSYFAGTKPLDSDIALLSETLRGNNYDLAPALQVFFTRPGFYSNRVKFAIVKSPVELEVMTLRLLDEPPHPRILAAMAVALPSMSEDLFQPPDVRGWPGGEQWITASTIHARYDTTSAAANGAIQTDLIRRYGNSRSEPVLAGANAAVTPSTGHNHAFPLSGGSSHLDPAAGTQRQSDLQKIQSQLSSVPPLPSPAELVVPSSLFSQLGAEPSPTALADAAVDRFLQSPLSANERAAVIARLGTQPLKLGDPETDRRVREMMGWLLGTPEYQTE